MVMSRHCTRSRVTWAKNDEAKKKEMVLEYDCVCCSMCRVVTNVVCAPHSIQSLQAKEAHDVLGWSVYTFDARVDFVHAFGSCVRRVSPYDPL